LEKRLSGKVTREYNDRLLNKIYANNTDFTDYQLTNYLPTANYKAKEMNHNVIEDTLGLLSVINNAKINGNLDIRNITGQYNLPISDSPIVKIVYQGGIVEDEALLTFGYYPKEIDNNFSFITKVNIEDKIE
jgi:hypothetical protein